MRLVLPAFLSLSLMALPAQAMNILLVNDDGLTSNVIALHDALVAAGHDVVVSVPCSGQSGMGAAVRFLRPIAPLAEACLNNAAAAGAPGAGPVTKTAEGEDFSDYYYVDGTPVMATAYGLDVAALARWQALPDLVLSGPNEGQNVGAIVTTSGTVSNAEFAAGRGIPAVALSAGANTAGAKDEAGNYAVNPLSRIVADLSVDLVAHLGETAGTGPLLPPGMALNVNFPDEVTPQTGWALSEIGTYNSFGIKFVADLSQDPFAQRAGLSEVKLPGVTIVMTQDPPTEEQKDDEAYVIGSRIAVTAMQVAYDADQEARDWVQGLLAGLPAD